MDAPEAPGVPGAPDAPDASDALKAPVFQRVVSWGASRASTEAAGAGEVVTLCLGDAAVLAGAGGDFVLYTFYAGFRHYSWRVSCRFSDAAAVFGAVGRAARDAGVDLPEPPTRTWARHETDADAVTARSLELARYLGRAAASAQVWSACRELRELLECGATSFVDVLGGKHKEGYAHVSGPGARAGAAKRWVVLKSSYVGFYDRSDSDAAQGGARDVVVVDAAFAFRSAKDAREVHLATARGRIVLRFRGRDAARAAADWLRALEATYASRPRYAGDGPAPRHGSFAPARKKSSKVACYIGGREYFGAVLAALRGATTQIFIADWRIFPTLMLASYPDAEVRLDDVLRERLQAGVDVYVLLYRELSETLQPKHKSANTAAQLLALGDGARGRVRVMRHPRHLAAGQLYWSHHEKLVVVDQRISFVGGMDLCEGRFDDAAHRLDDSGEVVWKGVEYYQPNWHASEAALDRNAVPRLAWHDVAVGVDGGAALDVALHFVDRWNHHRIALREQTQPLLLPYSDAPRRGLGPEARTLDDDAGDAAKASPTREDPRDDAAEPGTRAEAANEAPPPAFELLAKSAKRISFAEEAAAADESDCAGPPLFAAVTPRGAPLAATVQVVRSVGRWSLGVEAAEASAHAAWCDVISRAERFIYIEQQFFVTSATPNADAAPDAPPPAAEEQRLEPALIVVPPGVHAGESFVVPHGAHWISIEVPPGCGPGATLLVRQPSLSAAAQEDAQPGLLSRGISAVAATVGAARGAYLDATAAFTAGVRNAVGRAVVDRLRRAILDKEEFKALILLPLHPNGRFFDSDEVHAVMQQQFAAVCRGPRSLLGVLRDEFPGVDLNDYVAFVTLRTHDVLGARFPGGPVGEPSAAAAAGGLASEMVYIHSKLLIADDKIAVIGSANVNDRSMLGDRDTEVAVVIEDAAVVSQLRQRLWREHLGMVFDADCPNARANAAWARDRKHLFCWDADISDAACDKTWKLVLDTAARNTDLLERAFDLKRWSDIETLDDARASIGLSRLSLRLTAAPGTPEHAAELAALVEALQPLRGSLCLFPLDFLRGETLEPSAFTQLIVGRTLFQ